MNVVEDYFINQANVLDAAYKASVVNNHPGDTGTNREDILQNWLAKHIPRTSIPEIGGEIIDSTGYSSKQIDLVVYNNTYPQFGANKKSYFFTEGVVYAIQVKSILTSGQLEDAVKNLASVKTCQRKFGGGIFIGETTSTIPTGIFAYDTDYKSSINLVEALVRLESDGLPVVDFVCINKKAFIMYNAGNKIGIDKNGNEIGKLDPGYIVVENSDISIWNMLLAITNEGRKIIYAGVDFDKYILNIKNFK